MFRLEKIFQVDDSVYINITIFWKGFAVFLSIYIFSILEFNSIFDLLNYDIYKTSKYFYLSLYFTASYLLFSFILGTLFGTLPALQASKLVPVESLRSVK